MRDTEALLVPLLDVEAAEPLGVDARRAGDVVGACVADSRGAGLFVAADMLEQSPSFPLSVYNAVLLPRFVAVKAHWYVCR